MKKWIPRVVVGLVLAAAAAFVFLKSLGMFSSDPVYVRNGLAIDGYDTVAYHTEGRALKGDERISEQWNGARWIFFSDANRQRFREDPARYAPEFGGYCAYAVSENYTARILPAAWTIVDGKLYLNFDLDTQDKWRAEQDQRIKQARINWPDVLW